MSKLKKCILCKQMRSIPDNRQKCVGCRRFESNLKKGLIRDPEFPDVNTRGYKEPLQEVEDGYGFYGAIRATNDGELIQCHMCGFYYAHLSSHVLNKHKVNVRDYKLKYGLRINDGLVSEKERQRKQDTYNKFARKTPAEMRAMSRRARASIKKKGVKLGGQGWNAQTRNEKGMCRDQTAAKIKAVAEANDGVPTQKQFLQMFGTGQISVVNYWFGSWREALAELGYTHFTEALARRREEERENTIDGINRFYSLYGRTPQSADFEEKTWLPNAKRVGVLFGSLNEARREAGVPLLIQKGRTWVEVHPDEEPLTTAKQPSWMAL